jgi:hypothetical protein
MRLNIHQCVKALTLTLSLLCGLAATANAAAATKTTTAAPVKAAPAAKPASTGTAGKTTGGTPGKPGGATTAGHTGPTTSNPGGHGPITTSHPGGAPGSVRTATGRPLPAGAHTVNTPHGAVTRRADGRLSDVHDNARGMGIHHGLDGSRHVSVERADHSRLYAERGRRGYIEHGYNFHGHDFNRRAYYWHGHEYNRYYRNYYFHGAYMGVYAPGFYYSPGFYGWAYNPWYAPVAYGWGWGAAPWYGYYGGYFAPYPAYASPSLWLTDYMISTDLAAAYEAHQAAQAQGGATMVAAGGEPMLTPDVKAQIAAEVQSQIALENAEAAQNAQGADPDPASSGLNRLFTDGKPHTFVVGGSLDVVDAGGRECALSDGDALQLAMPPAPSSPDAQLVVLASKGGIECPRTSTVTVAVKDLQEMQNHMRETIDQGLQELQAKQGTGGLPAAPPSARTKPVETAFAQAAPAPDPNGEADIKQQLTSSDQAEAEAAQTAPGGSAIGGTVPGQPAAPMQAAAPAQPTVNIAVGQSIDQVTGSMGQPLTIVNLGTKKIYKYKDMKITFRDGKVADVE